MNNIANPQLVSKIKRAIESAPNHTISAQEYIDFALYDPDYGYYMNPDLEIFGRNGDFVTAPTLNHNVFAMCLAKHISNIIKSNNIKPDILELGAGNGDLMRGILAQCGDLINQYYVYDVNLKRAELLQQEFPQVVCLGELPSNFNGIILANELLDAISPEIILWKNNLIYQMRVGLSQEFGNNESSNCDFTFVPSILDATDKLYKYADDVSNSYYSRYDYKLGNRHEYMSEINTYDFITNIAKNVLGTGYLILIDYGYLEDEYYCESRSCGTIRGFMNHQVIDNILLNTGLMDITTSVNFSQVINILKQCGCQALEYSTQSEFLINCGILDILSQYIDHPNYHNMAQEVKKLTMPHIMGEVFKVIECNKFL